jgi:hypothetical protein
MSIFEFREWFESSVPAWTMAIPVVLVVAIAVVSRVKR